MTHCHYEIESLRQLIGHKVLFHNLPYEVIEVLEDGPSLVLQQDGVHTVIQPDQHGEAHRLVPETAVVPILTPDRSGFTTDFLNIDLSDATG